MDDAKFSDIGRKRPLLFSLSCQPQLHSHCLMILPFHYLFMGPGCCCYDLLRFPYLSFCSVCANTNMSSFYLSANSSLILLHCHTMDYETQLGMHHNSQSDRYKYSWAWDSSQNTKKVTRWYVQTRTSPQFYRIYSNSSELGCLATLTRRGRFCCISLII